MKSTASEYWDSAIKYKNQKLSPIRESKEEKHRETTKVFPWLPDNWGCAAYVSQVEKDHLLELISWLNAPWGLNPWRGPHTAASNFSNPKLAPAFPSPKPQDSRSFCFL